MYLDVEVFEGGVAVVELFGIRDNHTTVHTAFSCIIPAHGGRTCSVSRRAIKWGPGGRVRGGRWGVGCIMVHDWLGTMHKEWNVSGGILDVWYKGNSKCLLILIVAYPN